MASPPTKTARPTATPTVVETHHQTDLWGRILSQDNREPRDARFRDDTGTPVNWIHPSLARRFKLDIEQLDEGDTKSFVDFQGRRYRANQVVYFTMVGRDKKTYWDKYYIAPEKSNIDVILGEKFVNANGRARDVCDEAPQNATARVFVFERKMSKEKDEMEAGEAKTERDAQLIAERKVRKSQRDRDAKGKAEGSKSHKKEIR
ncbi:hypothetical protein PG993_005750 [Apiospora rasikravindrae]|uniref:Uncharacterized protein n=1 Tax=Apiospora rasikravindrae TaxID=990691 RepID=A0ABR1T9N3_9PEZI